MRSKRRFRYENQKIGVCKNNLFVINLMRIIDNQSNSIYNNYNVIQNLIVLAIRVNLLQYKIRLLNPQIDQWREY